MEDGAAGHEAPVEGRRGERLSEEAGMITGTARREPSGRPDDSAGKVGAEAAEAAKIDAFAEDIVVTRASPEPIGVQAIGVFVESPVDYIHDSWFGAMDDGALLRALAGVTRARGHVSDEILERRRLRKEKPSQLDDPLIASVYLAEPASLHKLVWLIGLIVCATPMRRIVDGDEVRTLVGQIGHDSYAFVVSELEFLLPGLEVDGVRSLELEAVPDQVIRHGLRALASFCLTLPPELNRRLALKLPVGWARRLAFPGRVLTGADSRSIVERALGTWPLAASAGLPRSLR